MDVVIPYRHSAHNGLELRYTLRGIEKFFPELENIFIIGDRPDFVQNIIHIPANDSPHRFHKQRNIFFALMAACEDKRVSDSFIWFSDDEFLLQPYQVSYNYCATLEESINKFTIHQTYRNTLVNTYHKLGGTGLDYGHGGMVFDKEKLVRAVGGLPWNIAWGYAIKSIYCGYNGITGEQYPDLKIKLALPYKSIGTMIKDRPYFSIDDRALNEDMKLMLNSLFPIKSQYEND
jgi:hypothetical protein